MMNFRSHNPLLVLQSCQPWWRLLQDILQVSCGKSKGCLGVTDGDDFVLLWLNTRCYKRCYSRQEWCNLKQRSPCGGPKPQQPLHRWGLRFPTSNRAPYSYAPSSRQDDCSRETWFKLLERRRSRTGISSFSSSTPWVSSKKFLSVDRQSRNSLDLSSCWLHSQILPLSGSSKSKLPGKWRNVTLPLLLVLTITVIDVWIIGRGVLTSHSSQKKEKLKHSKSERQLCTWSLKNVLPAQFHEQR